MAWSHLLTSSPRWLRAVWKSGYKEVKASVHPAPRETQAGEYEVIVPAFPWPCLGWGQWGFQMTGAQRAVWKTWNIQKHTHCPQSWNCCKIWCSSVPERTDSTRRISFLFPITELLLTSTLLVSKSVKITTLPLTQTILLSIHYNMLDTTVMLYNIIC